MVDYKKWQWEGREQSRQQMVPNNVRLPLTRVDEHFYGQPLARPIRAQKKITGTKYCALIGRSSSFYRSGVVPLA